MRTISFFCTRLRSSNASVGASRSRQSEQLRHDRQQPPSPHDEFSCVRRSGFDPQLHSVRKSGWRSAFGGDSGGFGWGSRGSDASVDHVHRAVETGSDAGLDPAPYLTPHPHTAAEKLDASGRFVQQEQCERWRAKRNWCFGPSTGGGAFLKDSGGITPGNKFRVRICKNLQYSAFLGRKIVRNSVHNTFLNNFTVGTPFPSLPTAFQEWDRRFHAFSLEMTPAGHPDKSRNSKMVGRKKSGGAKNSGESCVIRKGKVGYSISIGL